MLPDKCVWEENRFIIILKKSSAGLVCLSTLLSVSLTDSLLYKLCYLYPHQFFIGYWI